MEDRVRRGRAAAALGALAAVLLVTAGWWMLALWPLPASAPEWVARARNACFGARPDGLPDGGGWLLLTGQPLSMLGFLLVVWGDAVADGFRLLRRGWLGRTAMGATAAAVAIGLVAAGLRVGRSGEAFALNAEGAGAAMALAQDRPAPPLRLVDQGGDTVSLERFRGQRVIVTFAYAHCESVCPRVVHDALAASAAVRPAPPVLIITLDPWRDTPSRLAAIARQWRLGPGAHVLSGEPDLVERVLDDWRIPRQRDSSTGDLAHPSVAYVVGADGRLRYLTDGDPDALSLALK